MEDIKVNEYVRTKKGKIEKIKTVNHYGIVIKHNNDNDDIQKDINYYTESGLEINKTDITKHSFNLIDLIEVGDYVNGRLVLQIDYKNKNVCLLIPLTDTKANTTIMWYGYEDIQSILTYEQYEANCYKINKTPTK